MNAIESLNFFIPEILLLAGAFAAVFLDLFVRNKKIVFYFSLFTLAACAFLSAPPSTVFPLFFGFFALDPMTHFFRLAAYGITAVTLLISSPYRNLPSKYEGEYYSLFLFMTFGLILMAASTNLLMILLSIEFVSLLSYILVGFLKKDARAKEAALKYFLYGSLASGIMLYGMSLVFGATGSLDLAVIGRNLSDPHLFFISVISMLFFLAGLGFKISMAPFHMWAPDVYEAAPTPVTAFLTVGPKALGFSLLIRVLFTAYKLFHVKWTLWITVLSILTMSIGNLVAISQTNIKRLLAYSSIAQAGYILMGVAAANEIGVTGVLVYLVAYALTNLGAFAAVIAASNHMESDEIGAYAGLAQRSPFLAASLAFFFLSLAGIPPLVGFIAKFYVFSSAILAGYNVLAVAAALNSAVAAFYYFKVVRMMYLVSPVHHDSVPSHPALTFALCLLIVCVLALGLFPAPFLSWIKTTVLI